MWTGTGWILSVGPFSTWGDRGVFIFEAGPDTQAEPVRMAAPAVTIPRGRPLHRSQPHSEEKDVVTQGVCRSPLARDRERVTGSSAGQYRRHRSAPVAGAGRVAAAVFSLRERSIAA